MTLPAGQGDCCAGGGLDDDQDTPALGRGLGPGVAEGLLSLPAISAEQGVGVFPRWRTRRQVSEAAGAPGVLAPADGDLGQFPCGLGVDGSPWCSWD